MKINPRRPYIDAEPNGYMESDADYMANNRRACVQFLDDMQKEAPWCDCKVAFGFDGDDDRLWDYFGCNGHSIHLLPEGWELNETDGAGARFVAVFRVNVIPTIEDANAVIQLMAGALK